MVWSTWRREEMEIEGESVQVLVAKGSFEVDGILYTPPWIGGGSGGGRGWMFTLKDDRPGGESWSWYPRRCPTANALSLDYSG